MNEVQSGRDLAFIRKRAERGQSKLHRSAANKNLVAGVVNWGMVSFGKAELMFGMHGKPGPHDVSLWFYTDQVDRLYHLLKSRQVEAAQAALAGESGEHKGIEFVEDIYDPFYGGREFGIRDLNGYTLYFLQPAEKHD